MAKKKGSRRSSWRRHRFRHRSTQISLPIVITAAMPLIRAADLAMPNFQSGDIVGGFRSFMHNACGLYTGYYPLDNHFEWNALIQTYVPLGLAVAAHAFLGRRVNPMMKRIPFVGKYIGV